MLKIVLFLTFILLSHLFSEEKLQVSVGLLPPYTSEKYLNDYGLATEIIKEVFKEMGIQSTLQLHPWKRALLMAEKGAVKAIYPVTDQQVSTKDFYLSDPIAMLQGVAYFRKNACPELHSAHSLKEVKNCTIGNVSGSIFDELLNKDGVPWINVHHERSLFNMLERGRFDIAIADIQSGWHTIRTHLPESINQFSHLPKVFYSQPLRFGISKQAENAATLLRDFNKGLATIKTNGKLYEIHQKYNVDMMNATPRTRTVRKKACLFVIGDINDAGFNQMHYDGLVSASRNHGLPIAFESVSYNDRTNMESAFNRLIDEEKCGLIINADGYASLETVTHFAKKNPKTDFVLIEASAPPELKNIYTASFAQKEGSFVVGYLAAKVTQTDKIGFIGGVDIPVVYDFLEGFKKGILDANPKKEIFENFISIYPDYSGFNSAEEAEKLADMMYDRDIDIIYAVAGASNLGIIKSAEKNGKFVIGVDSDQDYLAKGHVLTSMIKRFDIAVRKLVARWLNGELKHTRHVTFNYKDAGVGITPMLYTRDIIGGETIREIRTLEERIRNSEVKF